MEQHPQRSYNQLKRISNDMRARTWGLVLLGLVGGFGLLIYQLYALQLRDAEIYRTQAVTQQIRDETLPAVRGSIYSATGKLLAKSNTVWNIIADPSYADKADVPEGYLRTASEELANLLGDGTTADSILQKLTDRNDEGELYQYKVLAKGVAKPVADAILEYANTFRVPAKNGETGARVLSLRTERTSTRTYPYGAFMSSVLGFCNADGEGAYGLEKSYNTQLAGVPGRSIAETNLSGDALADGQADVHEAIDGYDLNLTIDENIQAIVEEYLTQGAEEFDVHGRGCGIVMNVKTGAILAMATVEQFDPNEPYKIYDTEMSDILDAGVLNYDIIDRLESRLGEEQIKPIVEDGKIDDKEYTQLQGMMRESQWKNKNLTELYLPGSVFKLVTASAGLDSGVMNPNQTFYCDSNLVVNAGTAWEHTYGCALGQRHGMLDMAGALNHSCNLYFIQAAQMMNPTVFYDYFDAFGFTQPTGIDLPNETRWMSYYNAEQLAAVNTNLFSASFGQNMAITPMQMTTAVAAVANGGYLVTPYVVDSIVDKEGNEISKTEPVIRRQVISEQVSKTLLSMMENNADPNGEGDYHSCRNAYVAGYRIGGKSGTAEQLNRSRRYDGDYYKAMSFAAVLPVDDPEIIVFVMLDDPRWVQDLASTIVAPVVGNIISEVAPYLGLEQNENYDPTGEVRVENCINLSWTNAQVKMNLLGLGHKLVGPSGTIVYQYPYAGTNVPAGSTIYLYTNTDQNATTVVPDVTGKTGSFAKQVLRSANLNCAIVGDPEAKVIAQDVEANTSAAMGTVVTLTTGENPGPGDTEQGEPQPEGAAAPAGEPAPAE